MKQILTMREALAQFVGFLSSKPELFSSHENDRLAMLMHLGRLFCAERGIEDPWSPAAMPLLETTKVRMIAQMVRQELVNWEHSGTSPKTLDGGQMCLESFISGGDVAVLCDTIDGLCDEIDRLWRAICKENLDIEEVLGRALGYVHDMRDVGGEQDGVCVGEHTPVTLAREAAHRIGDLQQTLAATLDCLGELREALGQDHPQLAFISETEQRIAKLVLDRSNEI